MKNILLIEDEDALAQAIIINLELEGYHTTWIKNGKTALQEFEFSTIDYNLVILDVMIPEKDGLTVCKEIRKVNLSLPILFLSARNSTQDKINGLKSGANDYLGKPFDLEEFLLRVKNLLSIKQEGQFDSSYIFSGNTVYFDEFSAINFNNQKIEFSKRELSLLKTFTINENKVLSREDLAEAISDNQQLNFRVIDNIVLKFRKSFEKTPRSPKHFGSVRGVGYIFRP